jgi:50S ribosomal protein L16 3-hydroxylase
VQGVNLHDDTANALMSRFRFIPDARLDDAMISYATDGGGVGPHFDSYDVFLLQLEGKRRWRIGAQRDLSLKPGLPLKVLQHFEPTDEWVLEPGDMLYLPPHIAHDGIAEGECMTCSIGFRAPLDGELLGQFLYHAAERAALRLDATRRYADPRQEPVSAHPAALPGQLIGHVADLLGLIQWSQADVAEFLGTYLSEPKSSVFFDPPSRPLSQNGFFSKVMQGGVELDRKTILLYDDSRYYINGESATMARGLRKWIVPLADQRVVAAKKFVTLSHHSPMTHLLYEWYRAGWVRAGKD